MTSYNLAGTVVQGETSRMSVSPSESRTSDTAKKNQKPSIVPCHKLSEQPRFSSLG